MRIIPFLGYLLFVVILVLFVGRTTIILNSKEQTFQMERPILALVTALLIILIVYIEQKLKKNDK